MRVGSRGRAWGLGGLLFLAGGLAWWIPGPVGLRAAIHAIGAAAAAVVILRAGRSRTPAGAPGEPSAETPPENASLEFLAAQRILIIEDAESEAFQISQVLEAAGYVCRVLQSPLRVLEILQIFQPHLIITGIQMPGLDGLGLIHLVRQERGHEVPILVLSSSTGKATINQAYAQGADDYLFVPFETDELLARVSWALGKREANGEKPADR